MQNRVGSACLLIEAGEGLLRRHDNEFDFPALGVLLYIFHHCQCPPVPNGTHIAGPVRGARQIFNRRDDDRITDAERKQRLVAWLQMTAAESEFRAIRALLD
ncbi:hypothetical protein AB4Y32_22535 [Paraburkholderia phymatum]|uniref:Uncharacterized protein n=1 Tax=Paraburkholderia phymatum TaxID=148447 RepID=A0ACC6U4D2_9BURK